MSLPPKVAVCVLEGAYWANHIVAAACGTGLGRGVGGHGRVPAVIWEFPYGYARSRAARGARRGWQGPRLSPVRQPRDALAGNLRRRQGLPTAPK